jgi:uncharacterized protein RhaS with RHS repeats
LNEIGVYDYRHRIYDPSLGRFYQSDPTGFAAGDINLFRYCDDDPVDRSDPTGLDYQIQVQDTTHVTINIPIIWRGSANSLANQAAFTRGIETRWSGTWSGVAVTTKVTDGLKVDKSLANTVYIRPGDQTSGVERDGRTGKWYVGNGWGLENTGAHEAGHLLGRKDRYIMLDADHAKYERGNLVPETGYDGCNIMVTPAGSPDSRDISAIIGGEGKGYRGENPGPTGSAASGARRTFDGFGSATPTAASWEASYGFGGWVGAERTSRR